LLAEALVWTVIIVVGGVLSQDDAQVALAEHEHPVGALAAYGAHPAFGMSVRPGRLRRRADDLDTGGGEDRVEATGEFGVAVTQQEPQAVGAAVEVEVDEQVASLLGDPDLVGWAVTPATCTRRVASSRKNST
jgi:hypothetical protein